MRTRGRRCGGRAGQAGEGRRGEEGGLGGPRQCGRAGARAALRRPCRTGGGGAEEGLRGEEGGGGLLQWDEPAAGSSMGS